MIPRRSRRQAAADLEALIPAELTISVAGFPVTIKPCRFADCMRVLAGAGALLEAVAALDGDIDAPTIVELMQQHPDAIDPLCALSTGRTERWVAELHPDTRMELFGAALLLNRTFFAPRRNEDPKPTGPWERVKQYPDERGKTVSIAEMVSVLIAAGHRWLDIREYTMPQVRVFYVYAAQALAQRAGG